MSEGGNGHDKDTIKVDCSHEGNGPCCHKCGKVKKVGDVSESDEKCKKSHGHMKTNLHRSFCTFCGTKL